MWLSDVDCPAGTCITDDKVKILRLRVSAYLYRSSCGEYDAPNDSLWRATR